MKYKLQKFPIPILPSKSFYNHLILVSITLGMVFIIKYWYISSTEKDLFFILYPVTGLIELYSGQLSVYLPDSGFYFSSLNILINKSCSGVNFWVIALCVSAWNVANHIHDLKKKLLGLALSLLCAYVLTLFTNSLRILTAIWLTDLKEIVPWIASSWFHQAQGAFTYLSVLVAYHLGIQTIISHKKTFDYPTV
ncbi:exosortase K [Rapidithrix thailandica]|uniref:Exosortase K n=1 Tax=Rapidithrix thailandica TaxID=413964 RepID=A0AAW9S2H4_9BACT